MSNLRHPEFIEAELATYITRLLERCRFRRPDVQVSQISQAVENDAGYDACITSVCPFYVQLKRSYFYTAQSTSDIIKDRSKLSLPIDSGAYFFALHPTSKHAHVLQHNALHRLAQTEAAAYLAPLFFRRKFLEFVPYDYALWAWNYGRVAIRDGGGGTIELRSVRLFRNLITIPPHKTVEDANHRYSFTSTADVCFHSDPEQVEGNALTTFADFLARYNTDQVGENVRMRAPKIAAEEVVGRLPKVLGLGLRSHALREVVARGIAQVLGPEYRIPPNPVGFLTAGRFDPILTLRIVGNILEYEFGIRQYGIFVSAQ